MKRQAFVAGVATAALSFPRAARATGGLDVGDTQNEPAIRVLLASGDAIAAPRPLDDWHFAWNGRTYRGTFAWATLDDGRRALLNVLPLDAYLPGVIGAEISSRWPAASQEAQTIVARTFVLLKLRPDKRYDVTAGGMDMAYGGIESESVEGRAAVEATLGTIVTYRGAPAHVAFSSCCGGRTADAFDVWRTAYPYLRSVDDPNCADSPEYRWSAAVPYDELARALDLERLGAPRRVDLRDPDNSGRPRTLAFSGDGPPMEVATRDFRTAAGLSVVRSTFLRDVQLQDDRGARTLAVQGNGRGHGVGLCQWGAHGMGARGASATDIVSFYFPSTTLGHV
jgi:stage II sporulation protein D (peptidoglycan lytic transglycosylase)